MRSYGPDEHTHSKAQDGKFTQSLAHLISAENDSRMRQVIVRFNSLPRSIAALNSDALPGGDWRRVIQNRDLICEGLCCYAERHGVCNDVLVTDSLMPRLNATNSQCQAEDICGLPKSNGQLSHIPNRTLLVSHWWVSLKSFVDCIRGWSLLLNFYFIFDSLY